MAPNHFFAHLWFDLPLRTKTLVCIGVPLAAFGVAGSVLFSVAATRQKETRVWLDHTHEVRARISSIRTHLLSTESGARAFVINKRDDLLPPPGEAKKMVDGEINQLLQLVKDNPIQVARITPLKNLVSAEFASTDKMVDAARSNRARASKAGLAQGYQTMQPLSEILRRLDEQEAQLEQKRTAATERARQVLLSGGTIALSLTLIGGLTASFFFGGIITRGAERLQMSARSMRSRSGLRHTETSLDEMGQVEKEMEITSDLLINRTQALQDCEIARRTVLDDTKAAL
jgi:CHASE3 domain sensor protein